MKPLHADHRDIPVLDLLTLEPARPHLPLVHYTSAVTNLEVMSETINLVLSSNVRKNARIAADMAVQAALTSPDRDVWYINSYAGTLLLQESFEAALGVDWHAPMITAKKDHPQLPNLHVLQVPFGEWSKEKTAAAIELNGRENAPPVLIFNSFEFAALTRSGLDRLFRDILKLHEQFTATVIVFSHELRRDIQPGVAS